MASIGEINKPCTDSYALARETKAVRVSLALKVGQDRPIKMIPRSDRQCLFVGTGSVYCLFVVINT